MWRHTHTGQTAEKWNSFAGFRDRVLLTSRYLSRIVDVYYVISPKLIHRFGGSPMFGAIVRLILHPIIWSLSIWTRSKGSGPNA